MRTHVLVSRIHVDFYARCNADCDNLFSPQVCNIQMWGEASPRIISCFGTLQADLQVRSLKILFDDIFEDWHMYIDWHIRISKRLSRNYFASVARIILYQLCLQSSVASRITRGTSSEYGVGNPVVANDKSSSSWST